MKNQIVILVISLFIISACNPEDLISEFGDSIITSKSKVGEVLNKAKADFAQDAKLTAIYGLNVSNKGRVDLLKPLDNAFVYVVQSDSTKLNEFYVPVYKSYPAKSPINFTTMLSYIADAKAKSKLESVFSKLSEINISSTASYDDSPEVISKMLARTDVSSFRSTNPNSKIDMILIPSKSMDSTSVTNTADWIVSFYEDTLSLVLWLHPGTVNGAVDVISN
jgi:hypothetical protein